MKIAWTIRRHALAWLVLAGFALAYLGSLYLFYVEDGTVGTLTAANTSRADDSAFAGSASERGEMAKTLAGLRNEIAVLRRQIEGMRERLETMESAFGPNTAALPPQSAEPGSIGGLAARSGPKTTRTPVTVTYSELPEDGFGDAMLDRSPLPIAGARQLTRTMFGVELATDATAASLRKKWAQLGAQHKALLGGLQARHQGSDGENGESDDVKLIAGPFPNAAEAAQLCVKLRAAGTDCKETVFSGNNF